MKFKNEGGKFTITFNSKEYVLPSGEFDVNNDDLSMFIINKSKKWGREISVIDSSLQVSVVAEVKPEEIIEAVKEEEVKKEGDVEEVKKEGDVEEVKKEEEVKGTKGKKTLKK